MDTDGEIGLAALGARDHHEGEDKMLMEAPDSKEDRVEEELEATAA
jgi:hypothetical protein